MKSLLVLIDGLGDDPIPAWGGQTPFTRALHPNMDDLAQKGTLARISVSEKDLVPGSLTCILRLLGMPADKIPENRAYLELLARGEDMAEDKMAMRCNVVSSDSAGRLVSFNGMGLSEREMEDMAELLGNMDAPVEFIHLSGYRNLLVTDKDESLLDVRTAPPHESMGLLLEDLLGEAKKASPQMERLIQKADEILSQFNRRGMVYSLYPWGPSCRTLLPSFKELWGLDGAAVCQTEIVRGIAAAMHMQVPRLSYCTADIDTNVREKLAATFEMLKTNSFVMTHFNGTDEAAHRHDYTGKSDFIARIDREFVGPLLERWKEPLRIVISGDHVTSSVTGRHTAGAGPVIAACLGADDQDTKLHSYRDIVRFLGRGA